MAVSTFLWNEVEHREIKIKKNKFIYFRFSQIGKKKKGAMMLFERETPWLSFRSAGL